jgi:hypothetical protein
MIGASTCTDSVQASLIFTVTKAVLSSMMSIAMLPEPGGGRTAGGTPYASYGAGPAHRAFGHEGRSTARSVSFDDSRGGRSNDCKIVAESDTTMSKRSATLQLDQAVFDPAGDPCS